jgi:thioredoxin
MKMNKKTVILVIQLIIGGLFLFNGPVLGASETGAPVSVPVEGMVTMIDLGADACIPCKMMAPILAKLEKKYRGKAAIVFIDVWKNKDPAKRFKIRAIPTQIFFDKEGKEMYRHLGFMSEKDIILQLKKMGVD